MTTIEIIVNGTIKVKRWAEKLSVFCLRIATYKGDEFVQRP